MKYKILKICTVQGRRLEPGYEVDTDLMPTYSTIVMDAAVTLGQAEPVKEEAQKPSLKQDSSVNGRI